MLTGWLPALQATSLLFGFVYSVDMAWKLARQVFADTQQAARAVMPQIVFLGGLSAALLWLFVG